MARNRRTSVAWQNLTHSGRRLAVAVGGIGFAVLLMFMQTGFRNAMFDSTVQIIRKLDADVILSAKTKYNLAALLRFDLGRLYQARGCDGVAWVCPLYIEAPRAVWRMPGHKGSPIRVYAWDTDYAILDTPGVRENQHLLRSPDTVLFDRFSKRQTYAVPNPPSELIQIEGIELSDRPVRVAGLFALGSDLAIDGNLITSAANLARYFPQRASNRGPLDVVDLGLVKVVDGVDPIAVRDRLRGFLPEDVNVDTRDDLINREIAFWSRSTPIGFVFMTGMIIGFLVGVIICYQIINADISDHMPEFATLRAMGYGNWYFAGVVLEEAFYLTVFSFLPGLAVSWVLYKAVAAGTGLLMLLTPARAALVFALTAAMCVTSGLLTMRKVFLAAPAELF